MPAQIQITRGLLFRSVIADANCLFEVRGKEGRAWRCEVIPEPEPITHDGVTFCGEFHDWVIPQTIAAPRPDALRLGLGRDASAFA